MTWQRLNKRKLHFTKSELRIKMEASHTVLCLQLCRLFFLSKYSHLYSFYNCKQSRVGMVVLNPIVPRVDDKKYQFTYLDDTSFLMQGKLEILAKHQMKTAWRYLSYLDSSEGQHADNWFSMASSNTLE